MEEKPRYVGIDVSKAQVDVAVRPTGQRWAASYDETGVLELVSRMVDLGPALVLLEATGGLELPLVAALAAAALPVEVANPRQVRDFRQGHRYAGQDRRSRCGGAGPLRRRSSLRAPPQGRRDAGTQLAGGPQASGADHAGLGEEPAGHRHRRRSSSHRGPHRLAGTGVERLGLGVKAVSSPKSSVAREGRPPARRSRRGGTGFPHSAGLPARVGNAGSTADRRPGGPGSLTGTANWDSGTRRGKRSVWGGRARVRATWYRAAMVASRHNPVIRDFYRKLLAAGKPKRVAWSLVCANCSSSSTPCSSMAARGAT